MINPGVGRAGYVTLDGEEYRVKDGTYVRTEAPAQSEEVNLGPTQFASLAPAVSNFVSANWYQGYGLRRFSDAGQETAMPNQQFPVQVAPRYLESKDVDASEAGIAYLAAGQHDETLPGSDGPPVWFGEIAGGFYCIAGTKLYERQAAGDWLLESTLPHTPVKGAVGLFGDHLVLGYGAAFTAQYTDDLGASVADVVNGAAAAIYIFAFTADRASAYVAGGTTTTDYNDVVSSTDGITYSGATVVCGSPHSKITSLAPGGGIVIVFVGKETELGCIDDTPNYRILIPFDTKLTTNCADLRWYLATGSDQQRGPLVVVFTRDYGAWEYQPSAQDSGSAGNLTPWAMPTCRPVDVRGKITALQGTARWLYFAVQNADGDSYILKKDARTGAPHSWLDLGANACGVMATTSLFQVGGTNYPLLYFGKGNNVAYVVLPLHGDSPLDDPNCDFAADGTLDLPDMEFLFSDEDKIAFNVKVLADDVVAGQQYLEVYVSLDGAAYTLLGVANASPSTTIKFATDTVVKRLGLRLKLITADTALTPKLRGVAVKASLNPELFTLWSMTLFAPQGSTMLGGQDLRNPQTVVSGLWSAREDGSPVNFADYWETAYVVRIKRLTERHVFAEKSRAAEVELDVLLLEVEPGAGTVVWDDALFTWDAVTSVWG